LLLICQPFCTFIDVRLLESPTFFHFLLVFPISFGLFLGPTTFKHKPQDAE
jgi:hypothetical protein